MVLVRSFWLVALQLVIAAPQASTTPFALSSPSPSESGRATSLSTQEVDTLFSLHEQLVNIPSISGDEVECADFVSEYLTELGYYVEQVPVGDTGVYNVFAYPQELKDEGVWPEVLITSHIDTVRMVPKTHSSHITDKNIGTAILPVQAC